MGGGGGGVVREAKKREGRKRGIPIPPFFPRFLSLPLPLPEYSCYLDLEVSDVCKNIRDMQACSGLLFVSRH